MARSIFGTSNDDSHKRKSSPRIAVSHEYEDELIDDEDLSHKNVRSVKSASSKVRSAKSASSKVRSVKSSKSSKLKSSRSSRELRFAESSYKTQENLDSKKVSSAKSASPKVRSAKSASTQSISTQSIPVKSDLDDLRTEESHFVDARKLSVADFVSKILSSTAGSLGVISRPKVIDFSARKKEKNTVRVRTFVIRLFLALLSIGIAGFLIWLLLFSPVFCLEKDNITIVGANEWVSKEKIANIASGQVNKSLFLVSSQDVIKQLNDIPGVTEAKVEKDFPKSLHITVLSQKPAAMLKNKANGNLTAVDVKGRVLNVVSHASISGIPVIEVDDVDHSLSTRAILEAIKVVSSMPESLRMQITKVSAKTQDSVETELGASHRNIVWGDASDLKLKNAIVDKLINDPSKIGNKTQIDVSAPTRPILK
ncbi:cell division protein FtsQ/DivIB [uncultured Gardnerella sp.]|uniref:cell division protein FtsQ/DivIB n=1 Tax=uncultured Gardnerella sp. TaxID=293424 RepID=UPI0025DAEA2E|nr:FtsQ-type POTRA domain-containing protein [uncultured Gardnerella sp.]